MKQFEDMTIGDLKKMHDQYTGDEFFIQNAIQRTLDDASNFEEKASAEKIIEELNNKEE